MLYFDISYLFTIIFCSCSVPLFPLLPLPSLNCSFFTFLFYTFTSSPLVFTFHTLIHITTIKYYIIFSLPLTLLPPPLLRLNPLLPTPLFSPSFFPSSLPLLCHQSFVFFILSYIFSCSLSSCITYLHLI